MAKFPPTTSLHRTGAPFFTLDAAQGYARWKATRTGKRQRIALRMTNWPGRHRRWVVRSCEEAWDAGDRAWYREAE